MKVKKIKLNLSKGGGSNRLLPVVDSRQKCD